MTLRFGILVFPNVQQLDLTGPYEVLASARGAEVELIWKDRDPVMSSTRLSLSPTATFDDCPPLDVLCIPGGGGVNPLLEDQAVLDFVRERAARARYVTSVCSGAPWCSVPPACSRASGRRRIGTRMISSPNSAPFPSTRASSRTET